jgi:hypothetical protein
MSFFQKLNERHETLLSSMRSKAGGLETHSVDRQHEHPAMLSSTLKAFSKNFFSSSDLALNRSRHNYALRYDDTENNDQPSPSTSRPISITRTYSDKAIPYSQDVGRRGVNHSELSSFWRLGTWHRYSSMIPSSLSPCFTPARRPGTSPSDMSDEELEEWLEKPEDAEIHRGRKTSASVASLEAVFGQQCWANNKDFEEGNDMELTVAEKCNLPLDPYSRNRFNGADEVEDTKGKEYFQSSAEIETMHSQLLFTIEPRYKANFLIMPDEIILEIARHLDMRSVAILRLGCTKFFDTIPSPLRPLALKKT